jgi:hypothetical protein
MATTQDAKSAVTIHTIPRAERGTGAAMIAAEGDWNSRMAGMTAASSRTGTRLVDLLRAIFLFFRDLGHAV